MNIHAISITFEDGRKLFQKVELLITLLFLSFLLSIEDSAIYAEIRKIINNGVKLNGFEIN